jgi:hypothetical protein
VAFGDREDRVRDESVRLSVYRDRGVGVGSLDEAEDLAVLLVNPVLLVVDAVPGLGFQVSLMRAGDVRGGQGPPIVWTSMNNGIAVPFIGGQPV